MKVLITGGAGYIGFELAYQLSSVAEIEQVIIYDNLSRKNFSLFLDPTINCKKIKFINGDLIDVDKLKKIIEETDVVYHLADMITSTSRPHNEYILEQLNSWGTAELVSLVQKSNIRKFIYLSTIAVYGYSDHPIDIVSPVNPVSYFGKWKLKGEQMVESLIPLKQTYILRLAEIYGYSPAIRYDSLLNRMMFEACFLGNITIRGNMNQVRTYMLLESVVDLLTNLVLDKNAPHSGIYNVADRNLALKNIIPEFQQAFPGIYFSFSDADNPTGQWILKQDSRIMALRSTPTTTLSEDLLMFKKRLMYHTSPAIRKNNFITSA
jgi:UDP-glucose 4-epimerase